jgi:hypothetical protein
VKIVSSILTDAIDVTPRHVDGSSRPHGFDAEGDHRSAKIPRLQRLRYHDGRRPLRMRVARGSQRMARHQMGCHRTGARDTIIVEQDTAVPYCRGFWLRRGGLDAVAALLGVERRSSGILPDGRRRHSLVGQLLQTHAGRRTRGLRPAPCQHDDLARVPCAVTGQGRRRGPVAARHWTGPAQRAGNRVRQQARPHCAANHARCRYCGSVGHLVFTCKSQRTNHHGLGRRPTHPSNGGVLSARHSRNARRRRTTLICCTTPYKSWTVATCSSHWTSVHLSSPRTTRRRPSGG